MNDPHCGSGFRVISLDITIKIAMKITRFIHALVSQSCIFLLVVKFVPALLKA